MPLSKSWLLSIRQLQLPKRPFALPVCIQERERSPNDVIVSDIQQRPIKEEDMRNAKEAFLTGSTLGVMPIVSINDEPIGEGGQHNCKTIHNPRLRSNVRACTWNDGISLVVGRSLMLSRSLLLSTSHELRW